MQLPFAEMVAAKMLGFQRSSDGLCSLQWTKTHLLGSACFSIVALWLGCNIADEKVDNDGRWLIVDGCEDNGDGSSRDI